MPLSWFWMRQFPRVATFMIWLIMLSFRSTTLTQVWSFLSSSCLLGERGIDFDEAAEIVSHVCAYTNHTILAEALEKWPIHYLEDIVPQLVPIIRKLDEKVKAKYPAENLAIIDSNNLVHMAHMDIHYGFSINGVAALHTEILKNSELHQFYEIYPEKFNNKTNGITFRRWLMYCNSHWPSLFLHLWRGL